MPGVDWSGSRETFSEQTVDVVGYDALVRHVWEGADLLPTDDVGRSYIVILQVWRKEGNASLLFARQACPFKST